MKRTVWIKKGVYREEYGNLLRHLHGDGSGSRRTCRTQKEQGVVVNKRKLAGLLFYVAALCFYALAIAAFVNSDSSMVAVWISMGTVMIVLGAGCKKKSNDE